MTPTTITVLCLLASVACIAMGVWAALRSGTTTLPAKNAPERAQIKIMGDVVHQEPVVAPGQPQIDFVTLVTHSTSGSERL